MWERVSQCLMRQLTPGRRDTDGHHCHFLARLPEDALELCLPIGSRMSLWYNKKFSRHHMKKLKRVAEVFFFFFFSAPCGIWDLISLTRG